MSQKNDATGRRFKAVVRILKRLRNEMVDNGHKVAGPIPSYLIECLIWNVPNEGFGHDTSVPTCAMPSRISGTKPGLTKHARNGARSTN